MSLLTASGFLVVKIVICPGIHSPELTQQFLLHLNQPDRPYLVFPTDRYPAYSALHVFHFLTQQLGVELNPCPIQAKTERSPHSIPLLFISFSAGVIGAIGAAWSWRLLGGQVRAFIAVDGWGVPLQGDFPIHRISHDAFTHWSSALLGSGEDAFYADPPVSHLDLWRSPHTASGIHVQRSPHVLHSLDSQPTPLTNAADFLRMLLNRYSDRASEP
jgi:hypothetical protein